MNHIHKIKIDEDEGRDINTVNIKNIWVRWCLYVLTNA